MWPLWTIGMQLDFNLEFEIWKDEILAEKPYVSVHGSKLINVLLRMNNPSAPMPIVKKLNMNYKG
jgi:hypothetical protein